MKHYKNKEKNIPKNFYAIRVLWYLLGDHKKKLPLMFCFMLLQSLIALIGLGLIIPLASFVLNISYIDTSQDISSFSILQQLIINIARNVYRYLNISSPAQLVLLFGSLFICFYFLRLLLGLVLEYQINIFSYRAQNYVYKKFFSSYITMPYTQFLNKNVSSYTHILGITHNISSTLRSILLICNDITFLLFISISLFIWYPILIIGISGIITIGFCVSIFIKKFITKYTKIIERSQHAINQEKFRGFFQFIFNKLYHLENKIIQTMASINEKIAKSNSILVAFKSLYKVIIEFITIIVVVIYLSYISSDVSLVKDAIATFILLAAALVRIIPAWIRILGYFASIHSQEVNFSVIYNEYLNMSEYENSKEIYSDIPESFPFKETINIYNVNYIYPVTQYIQEEKAEAVTTEQQNRVLQNISLIIRKGERIGFVGESGGGKTTLCNIIMGFLQPQKGEILIDGKNLFDNKRGWQRNIGFVPQDALLFDGTIVENIAYGDHKDTNDREKIETILKELLLWETVKRLPQGMDTLIGDFGKNISGGQKQRLSIARALYRDPSVLVFDEATSNLDTKTEKEIQSAIDRIGKDKTVIIIAHRTNTLSGCDRIYSLSKGNIEFEGNYKQLLSFQKN